MSQCRSRSYGKNRNDCYILTFDGLRLNAALAATERITDIATGGRKDFNRLNAALAATERIINH